MHDKGKHALALARLGFKVFPLREDSTDLEPSEIKKPALEGDWKEHATTSPVQINKWWSKRNYNIAVATLPGSDLAIIDYDMKEGQQGAKALATHELLDIPHSVRVRTPTGGLHIYMRAPSGTAIPNSTSKVAQNVDVRGNERGGYVVAPGSTIHGKPYTFETANPDDCLDLAEMPDWLIKLATANRKKTATKQGEVLGELDTPDSIARATTWLKDEAPEAIEGSGGNNETFRVACRVRDFGISQETCVELLGAHWNDTKASPPWSHDDLAVVCRNAYSYASLPAGVSNAKAEFESVGLIFDNDNSPHEAPQPKRSLYAVPLSDGADQALELMADPLIDELLDEGALSVLYGPSNSGKTFVALDLAFHVAAGKPWHGNRTVKQGLVIYVAAEGGRGIFKRAAALKKTHGFGNELPFVVVPCPVDLLASGKDSDTRKLLKLIRDVEAKFGRKAELVVIDTLSRALAGGDENASTDMGAFIKHVDRIRTDTKAHVLVVHHTGKDTAKGARGWSGIRAATDTELEIQDGKLKVTKQRDIEAIERIGFVFKAVEIGRRKKDGKPVSSCVVEYREVSEFDIEMTPAEKKVFSVFSTIWSEKATKAPVTSEEIRVHFLAVYGEVSKQALTNRLTSLVHKGAIEKPETDQYVMPSVH